MAVLLRTKYREVLPRPRTITVKGIGRASAKPDTVVVSMSLDYAAAVSEEMLRSATENARKKAEILCDASGVSLGKLLTIDYNRGELNICSDT